MEDKDFYGILLNDKIPELDKRNDFSKKVKVSFNGKAYLKDKSNKNEKNKEIKIENGYEIKLEGDYEIRFINDRNETYTIDLRIECSSIFLFIFLFIFGILLGLILFGRPCNNDNSIFSKIFDYIDLAVIGVDIEKIDDNVDDINDISDIDKQNNNYINKTIVNTNIINRVIERFSIIDKKVEPPQKEYDFDATFDHISSDDINLVNIISAESLAKNKIAPGVQGNFKINITTKKSTTDMKYNIKFKDITNEKPSHMTFSVRGYDKQCSTLQELEESLTGIIPKQSEKTFIIDWKWDYETGESNSDIKENDLIDTKEAETLNSYKFKIEVFGEEVI